MLGSLAGCQGSHDHDVIKHNLNAKLAGGSPWIGWLSVQTHAGHFRLAVLYLIHAIISTDEFGVSLSSAASKWLVVVLKWQMSWLVSCSKPNAIATCVISSPVWLAGCHRRRQAQHQWSSQNPACSGALP